MLLLVMRYMVNQHSHHKTRTKDITRKDFHLDLKPNCNLYRVTGGVPETWTGTFTVGMVGMSDLRRESDGITYLKIRTGPIPNDNLLLTYPITS